MLRFLHHTSVEMEARPQALRMNVGRLVSRSYFQGKFHGMKKKSPSFCQPEYVLHISPSFFLKT